MLGKRQWLSMLLVASLATFGLGMSAGADSASEAGFVAEINASRAASGLSPLSVDGGLRSHARNHTQDMMDAGYIYHSSGDELKAAGGSGWTKLGENVGRGGAVDSLHDAFMASPGHRANILGDYNYVGVGTGTSDGALYVTVVFMQKTGSTPTTTTTQPAQTTTTQPAQTTTTQPAQTTTTQPAQTTTTVKDTPTTTETKTTATTKPEPTTTTTTIPPTTTTTLIVGPDKPVTPGESCVSVASFWWMCHD